jgi:type I restriction enzyme S subunit
MSASKIAPYPNYKKTGNDWFDKIPDEWNIVKIRRITSEHKQGYYTEQDYINDGIKLVRITDITDGADVDFSKMPFVSITDKEFSDFMVKSGDFLFARSGTIGRFGLVQEPEDSVFASYIIRFRFKEIDSDFMKIYLLSSIFKEQLISSLHGGANKNIHAENIKDIWITRPSNLQQRAIFDFVNPKIKQINEIIKGLESEIVLLEEKRSALITQIVTKGLNPSAAMIDSRNEWLGKIPYGWISSKLSRFAQIITKGTTPSSYGKEFQDSGINFVKVESISQDYSLLPEKFAYIDEETHQIQKRSQLQEYDVLFSIAGAIGRIGLVNIESLPANTNQAVGIIRPKKEIVLPEWIAYALDSGPSVEQWNLTQVQAAQANLSLESLGNICIPIPPLEEQRKIITHIKHIRSIFSSLSYSIYTKISRLKEYRMSLISESVTGKIDVSNYQME